MNMCPSNKRKTAPELCLKGQVFFIFSSHQSLESVKDRISLLGGKVDPFLSRDVTTILIEDNHLVRSQVLTNDLPIKSTYATNGAVVTSLPYQNNLCNVPSTSSGINFLAANSSNSPYRVICYARQWGIQVLGIDQFLTCIEPQVKTAIHLKKKSENVSNLSGCFIKFESFYKNYRPCYKMFNNDPDRLLPLKNANILVKPETCNVILNKPVGSRQLNFSHMDINSHAIHQGKDVNVSVKVNDKKPQYNNKVKPKEENNYCECCRTHFVDLKQHIKSVKHQNFVSDEKNYESVHNVLKMLPTPQDFIDKLQNPSPDSGLMLTNEDTPLSLSVANTPETDYPMPLNLQIKRDNMPEALMPIDLHVAKDYTLPVTQILNLKNDEEMPVPLDLHVKREDEIKIETKDIKQEINLFYELEHLTPFKKEEPDIIQPKIEIPNDNVVENEKGGDKQADELTDDMQCEDINSDPLLDKNNDNATALAQFCLKNLDSYWLENLPCEMDDMVFDDDIFDFDDANDKLKHDNEEPLEENLPTPDVTQAPELLGDVTTPNLKQETDANTSFFINSPVDIKDVIKNEPSHLPESFTSACKLEKDLKDSLLPENITSFNESLLEDKKQIFSIAAFCSDKIGIETSAYSNAIPNRDPEQLFSSDSSDDENGNVLISNALNFITNSDSEMKIDKDSAEENSLERHSPGTAVPKQKYEATEVKTDGSTFKESAFMDTSVISSQIKVHVEDQKSSIPIANPPAFEMKVNSSYNKDSAQINEFIVSKLKISEKNLLGSMPLEQHSLNKAEVSCETIKKNLVPAENPLSVEMNVTKQNRILSSHTIDELLYSKNKSKPKNFEENLAIKNVCTSGNNFGTQSYLGNFSVIQDLSPNKIKGNMGHFEGHSVIKSIAPGKSNDKNIGNFSVVNELLSNEGKIDSKPFVMHSVIQSTCFSDSNVDKPLTLAGEACPKDKRNPVMPSVVKACPIDKQKLVEVSPKDKQNSVSAVEACPKEKQSPLIISAVETCSKDKQNLLITSAVEVCPKNKGKHLITSAGEVYRKVKQNKLTSAVETCKKGKQNQLIPSAGKICQKDNEIQLITASSALCPKGKQHQFITSVAKVDVKNSEESKIRKIPKKSKEHLGVKSVHCNEIKSSKNNCPPSLNERTADKELNKMHYGESSLAGTSASAISSGLTGVVTKNDSRIDQRIKTNKSSPVESVSNKNICSGDSVTLLKSDTKGNQEIKISRKSNEQTVVAGTNVSLGHVPPLKKVCESKKDQDLKVNRKISEEIVDTRKHISPKDFPVQFKFCENKMDPKMKSETKTVETSVALQNISSVHVPDMKKLCESKMDKSQKAGQFPGMKLCDSKIDQNLKTEQFPEMENICESKLDQFQENKNNCESKLDQSLKFEQFHEMKKFCESKIDQSQKVNRVSESKIDPSQKTDQVPEVKKLGESKIVISQKIDQLSEMKKFSESKMDQSQKTAQASEMKKISESQMDQSEKTDQVLEMKKFNDSKMNQSVKEDQKSFKKIDSSRKDALLNINTPMMKMDERKTDQDMTVSKKYPVGTFIPGKDLSPSYSPAVKKFCKGVSNQEVNTKKTFEALPVVRSNLPVDKTIMCKESNERSDISLKKTSYKEKMKKKHEQYLENRKHCSPSLGNISAQRVLQKSFPTVPTSYSSQVGPSNCGVAGNTKETCDSSKEKRNSLLVRKHTFSETNVIKHNKKRTYVEISDNPCQYLNTTDKPSVNLCSSNVVPVDSSANIQTAKIPQKKSSPKLQILPPLWSVQILPGSGVRLKFTRIHHKEVEAHQSEHRRSLTSD